MNENVLKIIKKVIYIVILVIAVLIICTKLGRSIITLSAHSFLTGLKETDELHTVTFEYGGIAYYIEGNEEYVLDGKDADTKIKYKANVDAVVNLKELKESERIDKENKKVYLTLPDIRYDLVIETNSYDDKDTNKEQDFEIMGKSYPLRDLIPVCETDARYEIRNNKSINDSVIDNSKKSIEAFISPMLSRTGYEIEWEEGDK